MRARPGARHQQSRPAETISQISKAVCTTNFRRVFNRTRAWHAGDALTALAPAAPGPRRADPAGRGLTRALSTSVVRSTSCQRPFVAIAADRRCMEQDGLERVQPHRQLEAGATETGGIPLGYRRGEQPPCRRRHGASRRSAQPLRLHAPIRGPVWVVLDH